MDLGKLSYSKASLGREEREPIADRSSSHPAQAQATIMIGAANVSAAYQKQDGALEQRLVFVLSGGEKKEHQILQELMVRKHSVRVLFLSKEGQGLSPRQMQKRWEKIQEAKELTIDGQQYHLEWIDSVFLVSDVDDFYGELAEVTKIPSSVYQAEWIVSNPCIETWLYYCYNNDPWNELEEVVGLCVLKRSQRMKQLCGKVVTGGVDPRKAFLRIDVGIKNSREHYVEDDNGIPKLFSTQMYRMMDFIRTEMNKRHSEYDAYVRRQQEIRDKWRNSGKVKNHK